jgi:hypothetical protein
LRSPTHSASASARRRPSMPRTYGGDTRPGHARPNIASGVI